MMQLKGQVVGILSKFIHMIQNQFGIIIKTIRTDNGAEFLSHAYSKLLTNKGITHHWSCFYTPQQNMVVERKHKHILNIARALRIQSNAPRKFWSECILTTTSLIDFPWKSLDGSVFIKSFLGKFLNIHIFKNLDACVLLNTWVIQKISLLQNPLEL